MYGKRVTELIQTKDNFWVMTFEDDSYLEIAANYDSNGTFLSAVHKEITVRSKHGNQKRLSS